MPINAPRLLFRPSQYFKQGNLLVISSSSCFYENAQWVSYCNVSQNAQNYSMWFSTWKSVLFLTPLLWDTPDALTWHRHTPWTDIFLVSRQIVYKLDSCPDMTALGRDVGWTLCGPSWVSHHAGCAGRQEWAAERAVDSTFSVLVNLTYHSVHLVSLATRDTYWSPTRVW